MLILGIETSCDETSAALVENGTKIIANVVASSQELHIKTQGVIPEIAAREQIKCIIPVIKEALKKIPNSPPKAEQPLTDKFSTKGGSASGGQISKNKPKELIDAIAVTVGPGLIGSLLVGVETAKTLAYVWNKPIVPVNHLIGHIYTNFIGEMQNAKCKMQNDNAKLKIKKIDLKKIFPAVVLIVSGGHTELLLMEGHGKYKWLGGTRDDAAGECFDKCARLLNLPYPGGPSIEKEAMRKLRTKNLELRTKIILPRPMIDQENFDFSFSGLKTALINLLKKSSITQLLNYSITPLAFEVQEAITDVLVKKTIKAVQKFKVKSIILGGGVAANQRLREKFQEKIKKSGLDINFFAPPKKLCTDNAVGIASAAYFNFKPVPWQKITAEAGLELI